MASLLQKPVCEAVNALLYGRDHIRVLEAGCGSASQIKFTPVVHAVGIDIEADELEAMARQWRLDHISDYERSRQWMQAAADLVVDATNRSITDVAERIAAEAEKRIAEAG